MSALLPHVTAAPYVADFGDQISLSWVLPVFPESKFRLSVGPFSYFDARFSVTQSLFDWKSINAARAASQSLKSAEYSYKDARDLVVLAVGLQLFAGHRRRGPHRNGAKRKSKRRRRSTIKQRTR